MSTKKQENKQIFQIIDFVENLTGELEDDFSKLINELEQSGFGEISREFALYYFCGGTETYRPVAKSIASISPSDEYSIKKIIDNYSESYHIRIFCPNDDPQKCVHKDWKKKYNMDDFYSSIKKFYRCVKDPNLRDIIRKYEKTDDNIQFRKEIVNYYSCFDNPNLRDILVKFGLPRNAPLLESGDDWSITSVSDFSESKIKK